MGSTPELSSISVTTSLNGAKTLLVWINSLKSPAITTFAFASKARIELMKSWNKMSFSRRKSKASQCTHRGDFDLFGTLIDSAIHERPRISLG